VASAVGTEALKRVCEPDEDARGRQRSAPERWAYHHTSRGPSLTTRKGGREHQTTDRLVEPKSSRGQARASRLGHGETLTRCFTVPGAPRANKTAARA
jgi:hypothetical protein